jgi:hypothetical protein
MPALRFALSPPWVSAGEAIQASTSPQKDRAATTSSTLPLQTQAVEEASSVNWNPLRRSDLIAGLVIADPCHHQLPTDSEDDRPNKQADEAMR